MAKEAEDKGTREVTLSRMYSLKGARYGPGKVKVSGEIADTLERREEELKESDAVHGQAVPQEDGSISGVPVSGDAAKEAAKLRDKRQHDASGKKAGGIAGPEHAAKK